MSFVFVSDCVRRYGTNVPNPQVAAFIKRLREVRKLSLRDAADRADIKAPTWADLENGKHPPSNRTQRGIAAGYGLPLDWHDQLVAGQDPMAVTSTPDIMTQFVKLADEVRLLREAVDDVGELRRQQAEQEEGLAEQAQRIEKLGVTTERLRRRIGRGGAESGS